ncbi:ATP-dependent DNA helicase RecG [Candidatus Microgenomates bacterium]|nr:ATP-dependent DNA helicase RecG [Candidatus Microgenomates bacterium]
MRPNTPVSDLTFIGPVFARRLAKLGIKTLGDLLYHFPHRYEDFSLVSKIANVQPGEIVTVIGKIVSIKNEYTKRMIIQKAVVEDETGKLDIVWFNQRFIPKNIPEGSNVSLSGKIEGLGDRLTMQSPDYEKVTGDRVQGTVHTGRLVPVYPESASVSSKWIRSRIAQFLPKTKVSEFLPKDIVEKYNLAPINKALTNIHFPKNSADAQVARTRFAFEELFFIQLSVLERRQSWNKKKASWKIKLPKEELSKFISKLAFELTHAQKRAVEEVIGDLTNDIPMNRLLEGDVGSGKTVVAAIAAYVASVSGLQTAVMAPTQILAVQHYQTLTGLLSPHGIKVNLITGGTAKNSKLKVQSVKFDVIVGTHALLHQQNVFNKLAFVVIDEQHKFGVEQRGKLLEQKDGSLPHVLTMTATPIPRTITLTLYGDLELSILDELPPGRIKIKTWLVPVAKRESAYGWIEKQIQEGDQAFIVCPLIEESEIETMKDVKAATKEFENLSRKVFPKLRLGLLHGRMKPKEKDTVIDKFRKHEIDILVSTPVVEVGIDISNATIMLIEAAERFGLAQLHQLRGRVGRGNKQSYCLLFTESPSKKVVTRLRAMEEAKSGSELAELDLRLRGPGEIFGTRQHGFDQLKIANFSDFQLIKKSREAADEVFPHLAKHPKLLSRLKTHLVQPN